MGLKVDIKRRVPGFALDVAFDVDPGRVAVLFGPSGSGKSMTLRAIAGLARPDGGRVELAGRLLSDGGLGVFVPVEHRRVGYMFQDHVLFPHLTLIENVMFGARGVARDLARDRAREWIHTLRLEGLENRLPRELSGGQRQRGALARTIMSDPAMLLLDEPFSSLDIPTRRHLRSCLMGVIKRLRVPVVMVTHDWHEARALADDVIVMRDGTISQRGSPAEIGAAPRDEFVAELVGAE